MYQLESLQLAVQAGVIWQPYQEQAFLEIRRQRVPKRLLLYYRTGAGKSLTALACLALEGFQHALVVAPPSTHSQWHAEAARVGMTVEVVSHAKFRMRDFRIKRDIPIIADEFHMFGGNTAAGFKKLDRAAAGLEAPLILCSATPNYNDAERCYCVQHILAPAFCTGGYLNFLALHCKTRHNPFSMTPYVDGFLNYKSAKDFLRALPGTVFVPEIHDVTIRDIEYPVFLPEEFDKFNFNGRTGTVMASGMERKWARTYFGLLDSFDQLRFEIYEQLIDIAGSDVTPIVVFAHSSRVIHALARRLEEDNARYCKVTGMETTKTKTNQLDKFKAGDADILIGTAALATGTDGLDKVCDTLVILQDTEDDALRRQLIGRILPRGVDSDASNKRVYRFMPVE